MIYIYIYIHIPITTLHCPCAALRRGAVRHTTPRYTIPRQTTPHFPIVLEAVNDHRTDVSGSHALKWHLMPNHSTKQHYRCYLVTSSRTLHTTTQNRRRECTHYE